MRAWLIAVGTELLRFGCLDTNSRWLAERLNRGGVEIVGRTLVEDETGMIAGQLRSAAAAADLVVVGGGLGPTEDDRTREAVALALGVDLERDPDKVSWLVERFRERGFEYQPHQARQAERPAGARWLENPLGTAPGFEVSLGKARVFALPGVPAEFKAIAEADLLPSIRGSGGPLQARTLKIGGRHESSVDRAVCDLYGGDGTEVTILTGREGIELHLRARGESAEQAVARLSNLESGMRERLGDDIYGTDDQTLSERVGEHLTRRNQTLAVAESCTAGLLGATLTEAPGASGWFRGGVIAYGDALKTQLAGVRRETLETEGAVSESVARELAEGVRERLGADFGIGVTGIAGPGGASPNKPVGLVHLGLAAPDGTLHRRLLLVGDRDLIRRRSVTAALDLLRRALASPPGSGT